MKKPLVLEMKRRSRNGRMVRNLSIVYQAIAAYTDDSHVVLSYVENEDRLWQSKNRRKERKAAKKAEQEAEVPKVPRSAEEKPTQTLEEISNEISKPGVKFAEPQRGFY